MPKEYEAMKEEYLKKGKSEKDAERIAAATYNSKVRPTKGGPAMGPHFEERAKAEGFFPKPNLHDQAMRPGPTTDIPKTRIPKPKGAKFYLKGK